MTSVRRLAARIWVVLLLLLAVGVVCAPLLAGGDPDRIVAIPYQPPDQHLLLGSDSGGRDVLARLLHGGQALVVVPVAATVVTSFLGLLLGCAAALVRGPAGRLLGQIDLLGLAIPPVLVLLVVFHSWGTGALAIIAAVVVTGAPFVLRMARTTGAAVLARAYPWQTLALGGNVRHLLWRDVMPAVLRPILADSGTRLAVAIGLMASAGFLGFGGNTVTWSSMIGENLEGLSLNPWGVLAPGVALTALILLSNLALDTTLGDSDA